MLSRFNLFIQILMGYFYVFVSPKGYKFQIRLSNRVQTHSVEGYIDWGEWRIAHYIYIDPVRHVAHGIVKAKKLNQFQIAKRHVNVSQLYLVPKMAQ